MCTHLRKILPESNHTSIKRKKILSFIIENILWLASKLAVLIESQHTTCNSNIMPKVKDKHKTPLSMCASLCTPSGMHITGLKRMI